MCRSYVTLERDISHLVDCFDIPDVTKDLLSVRPRPDVHILWNELIMIMRFCVIFCQISSQILNAAQRAITQDRFLPHENFQTLVPQGIRLQ